MTVGDEELQQRLTLPHYPLSSRYSARWLMDNNMGPNPVWLAEALAEIVSSGRTRIGPGRLPQPAMVAPTLTTSGAVAVDHADMLPHGHEDWALWASLQPRRDGAPGPAGDVAVLANDTSRSLGFTCIAAHRTVISEQ